MLRTIHTPVVQSQPASWRLSEHLSPRVVSNSVSRPFICAKNEANVVIGPLNAYVLKASVVTGPALPFALLTMNHCGFVALPPGDGSMLKMIHAAGAVGLFVTHGQAQAAAVGAMLDICLINQPMQLVSIGGRTPKNSFSISEIGTSAMDGGLLIARRSAETEIAAQLHPLIANRTIDTKSAGAVDVVHMAARSWVWFK